MRRKPNLLLISIILICACAPFQKAADTLAGAAGTAQSRLTQVNQTDTPAPTPKPSMTPTLAPLSEPVAMTYGRNFKSWELIDVVDSQKPDLLIEKDGSFTLDSNWTVERAEFVYKWWGNADPIMDYQYLSMASGDYRSNSGRPVTKEAVTELLSTLSNLQPEPGMLYSLTHTDDFPAWFIEFTGEDGETVLLQSTSNSQADGAPWNVYYNGRYYASFDDSLLPAIQKVFPHEPYDYGFEEADPSSKVVFNIERDDALGIPAFTGLMPLRGDLSYVAGIEDEGILIFIRADGLGSFIPDEVESVIASIIKVEITTAEKAKLRCTIKENRYSYLGNGWNVSCPVDQPEGEDTFGFPIEIQFRTTAGKAIITKGVLASYWGFSDLTVPAVIPEWMNDEFGRNPLAAQLWKDHVLYDLEYMGFMVDGQAAKDTIYGEAVLLGETQWNDKTLRYTVSTPLVFVNKKLTRWDLTRGDIETFLTELQTREMAKVALGASEAAVLNLYVARWLLAPDMPSLWNFSPVSYEAEMPAFCSMNPEVDLPNAEQDFLAFAFNGGWYQSESAQQQLAIVDDVIVPLQYIYYPNNDDPVALALKPVSLNDRRFQAANIVTFSSDEDEGTSMVILLNDNMSSRGRDDLHDVLVDYFNNPVINMTSQSYWTVEDVGLVAYPDGTLDFIRCEQ